jgi:hypothetical protein
MVVMRAIWTTKRHENWPGGNFEGVGQATGRPIPERKGYRMYGRGRLTMVLISPKTAHPRTDGLWKRDGLRQVHLRESNFKERTLAGRSPVPP